jgi:hypothetical protein
MSRRRRRSKQCSSNVHFASFQSPATHCTYKYIKCFVSLSISLALFPSISLPFQPNSGPKPKPWLTRRRHTSSCFASSSRRNPPPTLTCSPTCHILISPLWFVSLMRNLIHNLMSELLLCYNVCVLFGLAVD